MIISDLAKNTKKNIDTGEMSYSSTTTFNLSFHQTTRHVDNSQGIFASSRGTISVYRGKFDIEPDKKSAYAQVDKAKKIADASSPEDNVKKFQESLFNAWIKVNSEYLISFESNEASIQNSISSTSSYLKVLRSDKNYRMFLSQYLLFLKVSRNKFSEDKAKRVAHILDRYDFVISQDDNVKKFFNQIRNLGLPLN